MYVFKDGYPAIIIIKGEHNHTLTTAEAASFHRPRDTLRSCFESYFSDGMGIKESVNFHESKLELQYGMDSPELANARINPRYHTIQHWFNQWRISNLGPRFGPGSIEVGIYSMNCHMTLII